MRVFLLIGFARGLELLRRLVRRREQIVGAFVFPEDEHELAQIAPEIMQECQRYGIPARLTRRVTKANISELVAQQSADVVFCLGWRTLVPTAALEDFPHGVLGVHDSLLPRLRGFAPSNWALLRGDHEHGATLFRMTAGIDEGNILGQKRFEITDGSSLPAIQDQIRDASATLFEEFLDRAKIGTVTSRPQNHALASYACARNPEDGAIDWSHPTDQIVRLVRALTAPGPGAYTYNNCQTVRILAVSAVKEPPRYEGRIPGRVIAVDKKDGTVQVLTGDGVIRIDEVQVEGEPPRPAASLIGSVRAYLGMRPALEVVRLNQAVAGLREEIEQLQQRITALEVRRGS